MKIVGINIDGFKNINNLKLELKKMSVLVAENSYGKSNVMKAINFAINFIKCPPEQKSMMMAYVGGMPFNKSIDFKNFKFEIVFEDLLDETPVTCCYAFEFIWEKNNKNGLRIVGESLKFKENLPKQKFNQLINRQDNSCYKSSPTGRCSSLIKVDDNELIINKLLAYEDIYYYPLVKLINNFKIYVENDLDASKYYNFNPIIRKDASNFINIYEVENIPRTIFMLKQEYVSKYELLVNAFMQLFPNIYNVEVKEFDLRAGHSEIYPNDTPYTISDKIYSLYVYDKNINQPLDFRWLSDGAKRIFLMLTYTVVADLNNLSLIAFEEPENSIHPALFQNYLDILYQLSNNCAIICASHSPYVIQYVNPSDIYIGKPNKNGLANFAKIDNKKVSLLLKDAKECGNSVGNYIFDLISGSEDDHEILLDYLEVEG